MKRAVPLLFILLAVGCGKKSPPAEAPAASEKSQSRPVEEKRETSTYKLTQAGGLIEAPGGVKLFVGAGLQGEATLSIKPRRPEEYSGRELAGPVWDIRIEGQKDPRFSSPIILQLPYDPDKIPAGKTATLSFWTGKAWERISKCFADPERRLVTALVDHLSQFGPTVDSDIILVTRWQGQYERRSVKEAYLNRPREEIRTSARFVIREEMHAKLDPTKRRFIIEGLSFQGDYTGTGGTCPTCHATYVEYEPVKHSLSLTEQDFLVPRRPETQKAVDGLRAQLEEAQTTLEAVNRELDEAKGPEKSKLFYRWQRAVIIRVSTEKLVASAEFPRENKYAYVNYATPVSISGTGHAKISFGASHLDGPGELWHPPSNPLTCHPGSKTEVAFKVYGWGGIGGEFEGELGQSLTYDWKGQTEIGDGVVHAELSPQGLDGGIKLQVTGHILHRIFVPKDDKEVNVADPKMNWNDVEGRTLPGVGAVLKAWVSDSDKPPQTPPDGVGRYFDKSPLDVRVVVPKKKYLILQASFASDKAKLKETCTIAIRGKDLMKIVESQSGSSWSAPIDLERASVATLRYEMKDKDFDLGKEKLAATLRKKNDEYFLEFDGRQSLWINTLALNAPYLNQNLQKIDLKAKVPVKRLMDICPPIDSKRDATRNQLCDGKADPQDETTVHFRGAVVCKPTCAAMILGCLKLEDVTSAETDLVRKIGQAAYDWKAKHSDDPAAPPWWFPFESDQKKVDAYRAADDAAQANPTDQNKASRDAAAKALDTGNFKSLWPYVAEKGDNKEWLGTLADKKHRPWQTNDILVEGLKELHPSISGQSIELNVFDNGQRQRVLMHLGSGRPSLVGIDVKDQEGKQGQHVLLLVGAVISAKGELVRLLFHDPYGDLTQHPMDDGYYDPRMYTDPTAYEALPEDQKERDKDSSGDKGAYAPYFAPNVHAYDGTIKSAYLFAFWRSDEPRTRDNVGTRLLSGDPR